MKIENGRMAKFMNEVPGIMRKRIPRRLYTAIALTQNALMPAANLYNSQLDEAADEDGMLKKAVLEEIQAIEFEADVQTIPESLLEMLDESDKYDALTGEEYGALDLLIEKDE